MLEVSEGKTNNYLVHGIFTLFGVLILLLFAVKSSQLLFIPVVILFVIALFLFTASNGLEIDAENKRFRKYGKIGSWKLGTWNKIDTPVSGMLLIHASNEYRGNSPMVGQVATLDTKVITYDIRLYDELGDYFLIYEFLKYKVAKKALRSIEALYEIPVSDKVEEKLRENQAKRRRR